MKIFIGQRTLVAKTCIVCGELKTADEFGRVQKIYWDSYCRLCHNAYTTPIMHEYQEESLEAAVRHRTPWDSEDIHKLLRLREIGLSGPRIALEMERTVYSVYTMLGKVRRGEISVSDW